MIFCWGFSNLGLAPHHFDFKNKRLYWLLLDVLSLLFIPLVAMQFTDEVNWSLGDFVVAAILLSATALAIEFVLRRVGRGAYRLLFICLILVALLLLWAELAVGIFR